MFYIMYNPPHRTPGIDLTFWQRLYYYWCWQSTMSPYPKFLPRRYY